ncbi:hypothetical protein [Streptomyces adustus]
MSGTESGRHEGFTAEERAAMKDHARGLTPEAGARIGALVKQTVS